MKKVVIIDEEGKISSYGASMGTIIIQIILWMIKKIFKLF